MYFEKESVGLYTKYEYEYGSLVKRKAVYESVQVRSIPAPAKIHQ